jgi:hypothetical protein
MIVHLSETDWWNMDWIQMAWDGAQSLAPANLLLNFRIA